MALRGVFGVLLWAGPVAAGELVWTRSIRRFGGNPLNGTFLLNQAEMQNHFPGGSGQPVRGQLDH
jgi:hypothetical protein